MQESLRQLGSLCQQHLLTEKWLLASEQRIAQLWKDRLTTAGLASINLHAYSLRSLTLSLTASQLVERGLQFADETFVEILLQECLSTQKTLGSLVYLNSLTIQEGAVRLLARTFLQLRMAGLDVGSLSPECFENSQRCRDLSVLFRALRETMEARQVYDLADCLRLAIDGIGSAAIALPPDLLILLPESLELGSLEQTLLDVLDQKSAVHSLNNEVTSAVDEQSTPTTGNGRQSGSPRQLVLDFETSSIPRFFHAVGRVNEIREVLGRILSPSDDYAVRLDESEILYSDYHSYAPLIQGLFTEYLHSVASEDGEELDADLPITFAEGIACIYSRPGRALRAWLRWLRTGCVQAKAVQMLREGLLERPENAQEISYSRLGNALRGIPIGFGKERYISKIDEAVSVALQRQKSYQKSGKREELESEDRTNRDFGLPGLLAIQSIIHGLVELAPAPDAPALVVLEKSLQFLRAHARAVNKQDRLAQRALIETIQTRVAMLPLDEFPGPGIWNWLEELPTQLRICRSSPQPGRLHIAPLRHGGYSGRKQTFIVGLDEQRFPQQPSIDPFLLDGERSRLSPSLKTVQQQLSDAQGTLKSVLQRALSDSGQTTLSYSTTEFDEERGLLPSADLVSMYREYVDSRAELDGFLAKLGAPKSFVASDARVALDRTDWQLRHLLNEASNSRRLSFAQSEYPLLEDQHRAVQERRSIQFGAFDGFVPAASVLSPTTTGQRSSSSRLETFGACPRKYFFRYGLEVCPPDELEPDNDRWLDALQTGNLLHDLFEEFMGSLLKSGKLPQAQRDLPHLLKLLDAKVAELKEAIPVWSEPAYLGEYATLRETCDIFLRKEDAYYSRENARPWVLEASIGLAEETTHELDSQEPSEIQLQDGRILRVAGRVDRIDVLQRESGEVYAIWDYKSGSDFAYRAGNEVIETGRKLQPLLYLGMLRQRLRELGKNPDAVASFGYFFPSPKTEGKRIQWTSLELDEFRQVLPNICSSIESGIFIATVNKKDCEFCEFREVCGDPEETTQQSQNMAKHPSNAPMLANWTRLLKIEVPPF